MIHKTFAYTLHCWSLIVASIDLGKQKAYPNTTSPPHLVQNFGVNGSVVSIVRGVQRDPVGAVGRVLDVVGIGLAEAVQHGEAAGAAAAGAAAAVARRRCFAGL